MAAFPLLRGVRLVLEQVSSTATNLNVPTDATNSLTLSHRPSTGTIRHWEAIALLADKYGPFVPYFTYFVRHLLLRLLAMSGTLVISKPDSPRLNLDDKVVPIFFARSTEVSLQSLREYARNLFLFDAQLVVLNVTDAP